MSKLKFLQSVLINLSIILLSDAWIIDPGPQVIASKGEVWPKPQNQRTYDDFYILSMEDFQFNVSVAHNSNISCIISTYLFGTFQIISESCMILDEAKTRYSKLIFTEQKIAEKYAGNDKVKVTTDNFLGYLSSLDVSFKKLCAGDEFPELDMDESCKLGD